MKRILLLSLFSFTLLLVPPQLMMAQGRSNTSPGQAKKEEVAQKKDKVTIGSVDEVVSDTITVQDQRDNKKSQVQVGTTRIVGKDKKELKVGAVRLKSLIALVSSDSATATEGGKLKVKKIFVQEASESALLKRRAVSGVITSISGNTLTVSHLIHRERTYTVQMTDGTVITGKSSATTKEASGSAEASGSGSLASLTVGTRVAAVGDVTSGDGIVAKRIHIIPGKATGAFRKIPLASVNASPVGTPSASVGPSSTPSASSSPAASLLP